MMNGFILQENTSILISRNGKTLYSILHRSLDLTLMFSIFNTQCFLKAIFKLLFNLKLRTYNISKTYITTKQ